jgi:hypothetical protein
VGKRGGVSSRAITLAVVLTLHFAGVISILTAKRLKSPSAARADFVTTWIPLRTTSETRTSAASAQRTPSINFKRYSLPLQVPLPDIAIGPADVPGSAIDWAGEAQREGASSPAPSQAIRFGEIPHASQEHASSQATTRPTHHPGEQYRDTLGNSIVWISDRCYLVSESTTIGVPQNLVPTRTVCQGDSGEARGDLFKSLPAYKKLHPVDEHR